MDKQKQFGLALRAAGLSMREFAGTLSPPVSESYVYAVLSGAKSSDRVSAAVDQLIDQQRPRILSAFRVAA